MDSLTPILLKFDSKRIDSSEFETHWQFSMLELKNKKTSLHRKTYALFLGTIMSIALSNFMTAELRTFLYSAHIILGTGGMWKVGTKLGSPEDGTADGTLVGRFDGEAVGLF